MVRHGELPKSLFFNMGEVGGLHIDSIMVQNLKKFEKVLKKFCSQKVVKRCEYMLFECFCWN